MSSTSQSDRRPRAFLITRNLRFDLRSISSAYELVFLSGHEREFNPLNVANTTDRIRERLATFSFNAVEDVVVMAGPQMLTVLLFSVLAYDHPRHTILMFNAVTGEYVTRVMDLCVV